MVIESRTKPLFKIKKSKPLKSDIVFDLDKIDILLPKKTLFIGTSKDKPNLYYQQLQNEIANNKELINIFRYYFVKAQEKGYLVIKGNQPDWVISSFVKFLLDVQVGFALAFNLNFEKPFIETVNLFN